MTVMDQKANKVPQFVAAISATFGGFCMGSSLGWTSPIQEFIIYNEGYGFPVTTTDYSFISGMLSLGAMLGSLVAGPVSERFGRKMCILATVLPCIIGWVLVIFSQNLAMLYIGRFLIGIAIGGFSCVCPLYINEIAEKEIRGMLGTFFQFQVVTGILFSYVVGAFTKLTLFSSISVIIPVGLGIAMSTQPESPYFYLLRNDKESANGAMRRLRGSHYKFGAEMDDFQRSIDEKRLSNPKAALAKKSSKKALIVGNILMAFQQFCGINTVVFFASSIFQDAGSTLDPNICTIITGVCSVIGTAISTQVIERAGRKSLLIISPLLMAIFATILGLYFFLNINYPDTASNGFMRIVPLVSVCLFLIAFAIGYGPIPWMYIGEILPFEIKGIASGVACLVSWLSAFVVSFSYPSVNEALKPNYIYLPFWVYAILCVFGVFFALTMVLETKGKTLNEIQDELESGELVACRGCCS